MILLQATVSLVAPFCPSSSRRPLKNGKYVFSDYARYLMYISSQPEICRRVDVRTRKHRHQRAHEAWQEQIPMLVDGYLAWKHHAGSDGGSTINSNVFHVNSVGITGKL